MESSYVDIKGQKFHFVESGESKKGTILLLHGFPECWLTWKKVIPEIDQLGYRVIAIDQRGYNLSHKPTGVEEYKLSYLAQDVHNLAGHFAPNEKITVIGHDLGGLVAWATALRHPETIEKLILINAPHPHVFKKALKTSLKQCFISSYIFFFQLPRIPEYFLSFNNFSFLRKVLGFQSSSEAYNQSDEKDYLDSWKEKGAITSMINWYRAFFQYAEKLPKQKIECNTTMICATNDRYVPKTLSEESLKYCQNIEMHYMEGASHWLPRERSKELGVLLRKVIEE